MSAGGDDALSASLLKFIRQGRAFSGHEPHCVFLNTHTPQFADISSASGLNLEDDGRAVGQVDWDHDGDLDLWIVNRNGPQVRFLRNNLPRSKQYIAVKLQGTHCNRDAIGARVEVVTDDDSQQRLIRSLRAGDGYLSQSSKWLHFGLAGHDRIRSLLVHWPDGSREEFDQVPIGHHYMIRQGTGRVETWPARNAVDLPAGGPIRPLSPAELQVLSLAKVPMPRLTYRTGEGAAQDVIEPGSERVVLLNLWAGWCQPCLEELAEFTQRADELRAVGIDVVALSVSDLDPTRATPGGVSDEAVLRRMNFPFRSGVADAGLVSKLQIVNNFLFDLHIPLPVPTSVLIDGQGRLAGIYKGRVSVEQVVHDAELCGVAVPDRRVHSTPFAGRWHEPLNEVSMIPLMDTWIRDGFLDEADDLVRRLPAARKEQLLPALVRLGMEFYRRGNGAKAQEHFAVAVRVDPTFVGVELALGQRREAEGRPESAIKLYREALRRSPQNVTAHNRLAWLLATHTDAAIRDGAEAVRLATQAVQLTQRQEPAVLDTLSVAYAETGDYAQAKQAAGDAIALCRVQGKIQLAREIENHLKLIEQGQPLRITTTPEK
jgi:tetratricopeptide (TPR) repeat protein/diadenosine tetraphosphatase ApaH/serine/threonine PP2A family protein phosphatase